MKEFKIDFAGVGAGKSGTTWTFTCLAEHPQVCMGAGKELNYFCKQHVLDNVGESGRQYNTAHYDLGPEWLEKQFEHREPGQILGEISPAYIYDPETPGLLLDHNPDIKIIFNLRNPVDAMYSAYSHAKRLHLPPDFAFESYAEKYPRVLEYYSYAGHVKRYLEKFNPDNLMFILLEDIKKDSALVFKNLCDFLGIDNSFQPESLNKRVLERKEVKSYMVRDLQRKISISGDKGHFAGIKKALKKVGFGYLAAKLNRLNRKPSNNVSIASGVRDSMLKYFRESNQKLSDMIKRDLSHWN